MNIATQTSRFSVTLAQNDADIAAAQRLRFDVFCKELGAFGTDGDVQAGVEVEAFDALADHLLLRDTALKEDDQVIGTYRLLRSDQAKLAGGYSSAQEFDLEPLLGVSRNPLELSRSCIAQPYRGGSALMLLWRALTDYVTQHKIDYLFGVASFFGTDVQEHCDALTLLGERHLAPKAIRPKAKGPHAISLEQVPHTDLDRRAAMLAMPSLIKAYLRMGGLVGDGAYVDHAFRTTDVCMLLETNNISARQRAILGAG
jgi:putative hemolysin